MREHLGELRALSHQIGSAISAVEHNDLAKLQSCVAEQERLCQQLGGGKWLLPAIGEKESGASSAAPTLREEIREAYVALAQLNRVYGALLKRAQRSCGLLTGAYRDLGQGYGKDSPGCAERHTWSCEV